ncbi:hypothetical protein DYB32_001292 [Aphanomyces invadans]|uniref:Uncharacterized protein n=1 Tax=Aphanomyces invadans TaxID=157072 RepID=A0A3R6ZWB2_9STRA|nr:hypothetical protein DYB32_001292 [Aphanomyces invadans]
MHRHRQDVADDSILPQQLQHADCRHDRCFVSAETHHGRQAQDDATDLGHGRTRALPIDGTDVLPQCESCDSRFRRHEGRHVFQGEGVLG